MDWWTHGRLVNYNQPNPAENDISNWLRENPHRLNLATLGLSFLGKKVNESMLLNKSQELDMWSGKITSSFVYDGSPVKVETWADPDSDTVAVAVTSPLLGTGSLGFFIDFPYPTKDKFNAPFVGVSNATSQHQTSIKGAGSNAATIEHVMGATSYLVELKWDGGQGKLIPPASDSHRHELVVSAARSVRLTVAFSPKGISDVPGYDKVVAASEKSWPAYWSTGAFVDLTAAKSADATELQRRTIQSQYLTAVNTASKLPPQGKFRSLSESCRG